MDTLHDRAGATFWGRGAVSLDREHGRGVSGNPGDGLTDRPKMAEALATLKEGLAKADDPLYDGWKLRKGAGAAADNVAAASEPNPSPEDVADTVPVRVVRYLVFPRWAMVVAAALVVFASIVTVVRAVSRQPSSPPSTGGPAPSAPTGSIEQSEASPERPAASSAAAVASASAAPRKVKGKKAKTQDPGFFRDPGF